ncbi:DNA-3-methyladenine glycosylase [Legionella sp. km772]|uniref:DNA-3-methyladenine glycosylase n=1 Tax=Legionella sp. km772 TaxID=2498111 RepID=UPI000F8F2456|nr:DNA-3-methyladenine glycosylase [Legionella sp. km772]RUR13286.1 DNA-3-methyladenine glycosylase [Legionella sp. km772]
MKKIPTAFYERDTVTVAKDLLGNFLVHYEGEVERIGKIVEVEAYLGQQDLASHSSKGITKRTEVMYGPAGFAYIYLIYGMYYCTNIVTEAEGIGAAVLIRALEPIKNLRGKTQGPGLLSKAMGINKQHNRHFLQSDNLFVAQNPEPPNFSIIERPRIGVHYAKEWAEKPLRFYIEGNPFISKK